MKIRQHSAVTVVFCALLALDVAHLEGEAKFQDTVLQYLESKEAKRMQNSGENFGSLDSWIGNSLVYNFNFFSSKQHNIIY